MATSRLDNSGVFQPLALQADASHYSLPTNAARIRRNGIEFHSDRPFPVWTEMTVSLQSPGDGGKVKCNGVVVDCAGSRHTGYTVSLLFLNLSRQSQERLEMLANARQI